MSIYLTAFFKNKVGKSEDLKVQFLNLVTNSIQEAAKISWSHKNVDPLVE